MNYKVVLVSLQHSGVTVVVTVAQTCAFVLKKIYTKNLFYRNLELMVFLYGFFQAIFATGVSVENKDLNYI